MKATSWIGAVSVGVVMALVGCSMGRDEAKHGVAEFRARVSEHAFNDVYQSADPGLRQTVTEDKFVAFMTALDRKLGPWQSAGDPAWNVTRGTNGHFVRLTYQSPILVGYHVNSPLLVSE